MPWTGNDRDRRPGGLRARSAASGLLTVTGSGTRLEAQPGHRRVPTPIVGDIALTASPARDEAGARAQVACHQPDGTWKRILDRPDFRA